MAVIPTEPVRLATLAQGRLRERRDLPRYDSVGQGERPWRHDSARLVHDTTISGDLSATLTRSAGSLRSR